MATIGSKMKRSSSNTRKVIPSVRITRVLAEVSSETRVSQEDILGSSRETYIKNARWEVWRRLVGPNDSIASLARWWPCDRTTIMHALDKMEATEKAMRLIGITGIMRSGKDTAADALGGFENVKMAGPLKAMLRALLAYQGVDQAMIDRMIDGDLKEAPSEYLAGRSPRHAMRTLGDEWGRRLMDGNIWVGAAEKRIGLFDQVVVSDIRYPNEVDMVRNLGGKVYRIERAGAAAADPHPSESQIATLAVDGVMPNTAASADDFKEYVRATLL